MFSKRTVTPSTKGLLSQPEGAAAAALLCKACATAQQQLSALLADSRHCPHFLPRCKALLICQSWKAGLCLGVERGAGILLLRLPTGGSQAAHLAGSQAAQRPGDSSKSMSVDEWAAVLKGSASLGAGSSLGSGSLKLSNGAECSDLSDLSATANGTHGMTCTHSTHGTSTSSSASGWSAPCFVTLTAVSTGLTAGAHRATHVIGVMSEQALARIAAGGALCLGAEWSVCLLEKDSDCSSSYADICVSSATSGLMVDVCLQSLVLKVDAAKNRRVYGPAGGATHDLLAGRVPLPAAAGELVRLLGHADGRAVAQAFEPSHSGSVTDVVAC